MKIEHKIEKIIYKAIEEINNELKLNMEKSLDTKILGGNSQLDSLGIFSFVLEIEKRIEEDFKIEISLINNEFIDNDSDHLDNVEKLRSFIIAKIKINRNS